jgi:hypothetical protein
MRAAILILTILAASPALAADLLPEQVGKHVVLRDELGRRSGTIEQSLSGQYIMRDEMGKRTGTIEKSLTGAYVIRDDMGRRRGIIER